MSDTEVGVRITGNATGAVEAFNVSEEAAARALTVMVEHFKRLGMISTEEMAKTGVATKLAAAETVESATIAQGALARWTLATKEHVEATRAHFERFSGIFTHLNAVIIGVMAVLAGGEAFEHAIEKTNELAADNLKLSKTFGMTLTEASGFHAALNKFGIDTETVTGAVQKMDRQLKSHESALVDMGVQTRDANGHLRNQLDIFMSGLDALRQYKEGTDRNLAAQTMFGRGVGDVAALLKLNRGELEEGADTARKLGLVTDQEGVESMKRYKIAIAETKEVFEAIMVAIGKKVLPLLTQLAEYIKNHGEAVMESFRKALDLVANVLGVVGSAIGALWSVAKAAFSAIGALIEAVFGKTAATEFGKFDNWLLLIKGTVQIFKGALVLAFQVIEAAITELAARVELAGSLIRDWLTFNWDKLAGDWDTGMKKIDAVVIANAKKIKGTLADMMKPVTLGGDTAPGGYDKDAVQGLLQSGYNGLGAGKKDFTGAPKKEKKPKADKGDEFDELAARKEANHALDELDKRLTADQLKQSKEREAGAMEESKGKTAAGLDYINTEEELAKQRVAQGLETQKQLLVEERAFETERSDILIKGIKERIQIAQTDGSSPVEKQRLYNELAAAERKFQDTLTKIDGAATLERTKNARAAADAVATSWGTALARMATLQAGFATTLNGMWGGIVSMVETAIGRMLSTFLSSLITQGAAQAVANAKHRISESKMIYLSTVKAVSQAGAPPPIPQIAGAAAFAGAMAFSAKGGWDVPGNVGRGIDGMGGQVGIVHPREMILPADVADRFRSGGAGAEMHVHIHATDAESVKRLFMNNKSTMAAAIKAALRDGVR